MTAPLQSERLKGRKDLVSDKSQYHLEHERIFIPKSVSDAERYRNHSIDLHIHFLWSDRKYCAVAERTGETKELNAVEEDATFVETRLREDELTVLVGILESLEHSEGVVLGVYSLGSLHKRLRLLDRYNCVGWDAFGLGAPGIKCIRMSTASVRRVDLKGIGREDRELSAALILTWDDRADEVIQGGTDIEENVASDNRDPIVEVDIERNGILELAIGIEHFSNRAVLAVNDRNPDKRFQLLEMFFGSKKFELPALDRSHGTTGYATTSDGAS